MSTLGSSDFPAENARAALQEILLILTSPTENDKLRELAEARETAGNDLLKHMQYVFPALTNIQMEVIAKYGFSPDGEGVIAFTHAVRALERDHPDIASSSSELQAFFIPPMVPPSQNADYDG